VRRGWAVVALVVLAAAPALGAGCKKEGSPSAEPAASASGRRGGKGAGAVFPVEVMTVESKKLDTLVTAPGTIEAFERVQVTARVAGVVDRVAFSEGQTVKKGDALVVIDSERYQLSVNQAKAVLEKADATVKDVEASVARREGASAQHPGLIPGEELETYRTKVLTAKADRASAAEGVKVAELNLRDSHVRAPIEGVIQTRTVETGQYVQPGYVMATLLRSDPLLLRFQVEPLEAPRLKPGMSASFTLRETQRTYTAKITLVAAAADPVTHMVGVSAEVTEDAHKYWLRPGTFCEVSVDVSGARDVVAIPRSSMRATDHGYVAYVVENDAAVERELALGMSTKDGWVEVKNGLKAGDVLVVRGVEALSKGAKVRVARPGAPPDGWGAAPAGSGSGGRRRDRGAGSGAPPGAPPP